jgi:hypothetical protein
MRFTTEWAEPQARRAALGLIPPDEVAALNRARWVCEVVSRRQQWLRALHGVLHALRWEGHVRRPYANRAVWEGEDVCAGEVLWQDWPSAYTSLNSARQFLREEAEEAESLALA